MADGVKFSQFSAASGISDSDEAVGLSGGTNKRFSFTTIKAWVKSAITAASIGAVETSAVGTAGGVASLDNSGKVPSSQLPTMPSNVVANPAGTATDNLTKLQVDQTIYAVSGGGGGVDYLTVVNGKVCIIYEVTP